MHTMNVMEMQGGITVVENKVVEVAFSGKAVGNVDPRFPADDFEANRAKLHQAIGIGKYTVQVCQLKADFIDLSTVATEDIEPAYCTDGMFINRDDVILGLNTADCSAIALFDTREPNAVGLIHAGRQGVAGDIHLAALEHLTGEHDVPKEHVGMVFAPSIHQDSYFFPSLPAEQLADPKWRRFIELRAGNYHVDLLGRVIDDLVAEGIDVSQMEVSPIDVGSNEAYFSHARAVRTGETEGRNGIVAKLRSL